MEDEGTAPPAWERVKKRRSSAQMKKETIGKARESVKESKRRWNRARAFGSTTEQRNKDSTEEEKAKVNDTMPALEDSSGENEMKRDNMQYHGILGQQLQGAIGNTRKKNHIGTRM